MPSDTAVRTFDLAAPKERVFALLCDPRLLPEVHPLITAVNVTRDGVDGADRVVDFDVEEQVPLLGLSVPNRYRGQARWRPGEPDRLVLAGWSAPSVTVWNSHTLTTLPTGTRVRQEVTVTAPWPVSGFVFRTARAAHDASAARWVAYVAGRG